MSTQRLDMKERPAVELLGTQLGTDLRTMPGNERNLNPLSDSIELPQEGSADSCPRGKWVVLFG